MRPVLEDGISARDRGVARGLLSQPLNAEKDCMVRDEARKRRLQELRKCGPILRVCLSSVGSACKRVLVAPYKSVSLSQAALSWRDQTLEWARDVQRIRSVRSG